MAPSGSRLRTLSSSMGIPQHWQTSLKGSPRSVWMDTPKKSDSCRSVSIPGRVAPVSQRDTACRVTWSFSASASWESPRLVRSCCKIFCVFI